MARCKANKIHYRTEAVYFEIVKFPLFFFFLHQLEERRRLPSCSGQCFHRTTALMLNPEKPNLLVAGMDRA